MEWKEAMIWQPRYAALQGCVLPFDKHLLIHSETKRATILVSESLNHSLNQFFSKIQIQLGSKLPCVAPRRAAVLLWIYLDNFFSGGALKHMLLNIYLFIVKIIISFNLYQKERCVRI